MSDVSAVAETSGQMPNFLIEKSGVHWVSVMNSTNETTRKNAIVSPASDRMMPAVVNAPIVAATKNSPAMAPSLSCRDRLCPRLTRDG
ncbi:MAG: hypothetical protein KatS3mg063_2569 [Tepidiforma sp.]|nr:hypothetical protein [Tepidiforma sp.]GIW16716.1 MAG: hypothetical protein KatS3mg063_2569 [Tepidiforma sp.]